MQSLFSVGYFGFQALCALRAFQKFAQHVSTCGKCIESCLSALVCGSVFCHLLIKRLDQPAIGHRVFRKEGAALRLTIAPFGKYSLVCKNQGFLPQALIGCLQGAALLFKVKLETLVGCGVKQLAKDLAALLRLRGEELAEFALGDHDDLRKLHAVDSQELLDGSFNFFRLGENAAIGSFELYGGLTYGHALATLSGSFVLRTATDAIGSPSILEGELNEGFGFRLGEVAAQRAHRAHPARCLPVEGEGDGVEDSGFACARIAADEIQA